MARPFTLENDEMEHAIRTAIAIGCAFFAGVHLERGDLMSDPLNMMGLVVALGLGVYVAFPKAAQ